MDPDLLTQLVRAGNDGVIPAPLAGEDMRVYKFRAACAGAVVAAQWMEKTMADKAAIEQEEKERARGEIEDEFSAAGLGRPGDVTVTTSTASPDGKSLHPRRTSEEIDRILRRPHLNGAGTRGDQLNGQDRHPDEIGVD